MSCSVLTHRISNILKINSSDTEPGDEVNLFVTKIGFGTFSSLIDGQFATAEDFDQKTLKTLGVYTLTKSQ